MLYEDGSASPPDTYPLAAAVRTQEPQTAVRGHRNGTGAVAWIEVAAHPLRSPDDEHVYAVLGVLTDLTAERDWELQRLRPPGQLGPRRPVPLDIARILDEIPPHLFPEQFASEARRLSGGPVALYVLDIDGTHLLRLAGPEDFPERIEAPLALGPELAEDGIPELAARLASELPGASMVPMWLRGRAIGLLLALATPAEALAELARHGAAAMELAGGYTDVFDAARRRKDTHPAAELQQSLLPPRIARIGGGELAGSVLPAYEIGGDWFDYVENRDGAWLAVADAVGKGATAGALGSIALAALRAARRSGATLEEAARTMHEAVCDVSRPEFFVTAIVARWNAVYSSLSWINCGHPPPLVVRADDTIEQLMVEADLPLGLWERERRFVRHQRRLDAGRAPDPPLRRHHRAPHARRSVRPRRDRASGPPGRKPLRDGHGESDSGSRADRSRGPAPGRCRGGGAGPGAAGERPRRRPDRGASVPGVLEAVRRHPSAILLLAQLAAVLALPVHGGQRCPGRPSSAPSDRDPRAGGHGRALDAGAAG